MACTEERTSLDRQLLECYGFSEPAVEVLPVTTRNALYRIVVGECGWVLKLFKVSGNYSRERITEHVSYEAQLISALIERGIPIAAIQPMLDGELIATIDGHPALLFEEMSGSILQRDKSGLQCAVSALVQLHAVQLEQPLAVETGFHFDDACMIWLPLFHQYRFDGETDEEVVQLLNRYAPLMDELNAGERRGELFAGSPSIHCHGDVRTENMMSDTAASVRLFDFNNAFYGPRIVDVIDGAFQFAMENTLFFDQFLDAYMHRLPLTDEEQESLGKWIALVGVMEMAKQVLVLRDPEFAQHHEDYRKRLHSISSILSRCL